MTEPCAICNSDQHTACDCPQPRRTQREELLYGLPPQQRTFTRYLEEPEEDSFAGEYELSKPVGY